MRVAPVYFSPGTNVPYKRMTHHVFPRVPAGVSAEDADSSHMASGTASPPDGRATWSEDGDGDNKNDG